MKDFSILEEKLNLKFKNKDLLIQAFIHRSYLNENQDFHLSHNERLEFLGDAVLELTVTDYLYRHFPNREEGDLTSWRASLVNTKILSDTAEGLEFHNFLLLSKGEEKNINENQKARQDILADTFEAFIGALYLDQGFKACYAFISQYLITKLSWILKNKEFVDAKSRFQEIAQEKEKITPTYKILEEWGPDHDKHFVSGVYLGDKLIAEGQGLSKREAEEEAARKALEKRGWK